MKNNYNPYTVPENFFEIAGKQAMTRFSNRRRAIHCGIAAAVFAAVIVATPLLVHTDRSQIQESELVSSNLAGMYEYDVFLQVNFTE